MKTVLYILLVATVISCKQDPKDLEVKVSPSQLETTVAKTVSDLNSTETRVEVSFEKEFIGVIYDSYLELKGALVNTDAQEVASIATEIKNMIASFELENETLVKMTTVIDKIAASNDVKKQRMLFEHLTDEVERLLAGAVVTGKVFKQYCPMAFDGKGAYWLSNSTEIRNPYFGDKMLKCGVVDKEIQ